MTDRDSVINYLDEISHYDGEQMFYNDIFIRGIANYAIALLKEQGPRAIEYHDNPFTGLPVAHCPNCMRFAGQFYASVEEETHYCPWCGQAVKWDV